jgi:hypothetical protein
MLMPTIRIDLQDGFAGDTIVVRAGEHEIFRGDGVRTSRLLGFAHSVSADVPWGRLPISVDVPSRGLQGQTTVDVNGEVYLGVSISPEGVAFQPSNGPFGYA